MSTYNLKDALDCAVAQIVAETAVAVRSAMAANGQSQTVSNHLCEQIIGFKYTTASVDPFGPIAGIECRTPQEVFDIMCARFRTEKSA